jgi:hypothetical protein
VTPQPELVTVEGDRFVQIRHRDTNMIKTE